MNKIHVNRNKHARNGTIYFRHFICMRKMTHGIAIVTDIVELDDLAFVRFASSLPFLLKKFFCHIGIQFLVELVLPNSDL